MSSPCTLVIVQETVGRLLLGAARKDRRQRLARMPLPGRPQPLQPLPQAPVGQVRALELAPRPTGLVVHREGRKRPRRPHRRPPQRLLPIRFQASQPHALRLGRARRPRRPPRGPAHALPARRPIARRGPRRLHARLHQHRPHPVARFPVRRQTPHRPAQHVRGQVRHPHPRQQQKPVVGDHLLDVRPARAVVPAQMRVARPQPQRRRHEAQHPQRTRRRLQQIRQPAARRPRPTARMARRQQTRAQLPLRLRFRHPQPDLAQLLQAATKLGQRPPRRARALTPTPARRTRLRRRQRQTQLRRQLRQSLARRGRAQLPPAGCASRPARTARVPEQPVKAPRAATPVAATRPPPASKGAAQPALIPFYTEPPPCVNCD